MLTELQNCQNGIFRLLKGLKTDSKEVLGVRCMGGSDRKLCFCEMKRGILDGCWKGSQMKKWEEKELGS